MEQEATEGTEWLQTTTTDLSRNSPLPLFPPVRIPIGIDQQRLNSRDWEFTLTNSFATRYASSFS